MREWQRTTLIIALILGLTLGTWSTIGGTGPSAKTVNLPGRSTPQGTRTQIFFDDFDGTDLSSDWVIVSGYSTYTVSGGYLRIYQNPTRLMIDVNSDYATNAPCKITTRARASGQGMGSPNFVKLHQFGTDGNDEVTKAWWIAASPNTARMRNVNDGAGAGAESGDIYLDDITEWHTYSLEWTETSTSLYQDDVLKATLTNYIPDEPLVPAFWSAQGGNTALYMEIDWIRLETIPGNTGTGTGTGAGLPIWLNPIFLAAIIGVIVAVVAVAVVLVLRRRSVETPSPQISHLGSVCRECGFIGAEGDIFCQRCGRKLPS